MGAWSVRTRFASCSPISESFSVSLEARAHDAFNGFRAATYWDDSMRAALRMSALRRSATAAATALCCAVRRSATTCFRGSHEPTRRSVCEVNDDWVIPDMAGIGAGYTCTGDRCRYRSRSRCRCRCRYIDLHYSWSQQKEAEGARVVARGHRLT